MNCQKCRIVNGTGRMWSRNSLLLLSTGSWQFFYFCGQLKKMRSPKILIIAVLFFGIKAQAQLRVFGGPQITSANYSIQNAPQATESKIGYMAGVSLTTLVEGPLYFTPSLFYSQKGYKVTLNRPSVPPDADAKNNNTSIHSISFAPLLQVNFSKSPSYGFFRFGPALDIPISGKETFDSTGDKQISRSMTFGSTAYSQGSFYANVHLGYQHQGGLTLFVHYEHGLSNLNNSDFGPMILQRNAGVSVGWRF